MNDEWDIGGVILPCDLQWIDEFTNARKQAASISLAGTSIVQLSTQQNGLPMTLRTPDRVFVTRQHIDDLAALRDDPATDVFTVVHPDGRTFNCRFRHSDGLPVDWANTRFLAPPIATDAWHTLTLRLMTA